jgi:chemotaxis regulatin CheY-phosphate phosphatase CheZ
MADEAQVEDQELQAVDTAEPENAPADPPSEIEELAREMGWRPQDEFAGDADKWVDAKSFVRNTRDINRNLSRDLRDLKKQMDGIGRATSQMTERAVAAERERLEALHDQAVEDGDKAAAKRAVDAINKLPTAQAEVPSETQAFVEKHSAWFNKDQEATAYAVQRAGKYADEGLSPARQLAAVEKDMRKHFPDLFKDDEAPARKDPPKLATPTGRSNTTPREKGYATLPSEARKACDEWVAAQKEQGHAWATKEAWATSYYGQEAANG